MIGIPYIAYIINDKDHSIQVIVILFKVKTTQSLSSKDSMTPKGSMSWNEFLRILGSLL